MIVTELKMKDAGKYSVKVGDIESTANLTVTGLQRSQNQLDDVIKSSLAPPIKFRQRLVNTEVAERGTAVFDCSINNKEVPAKWKVNGKLIKSNKKYLPKRSLKIVSWMLQFVLDTPSTRVMYIH